MDAETALGRLKQGNDSYVKAEGYSGDVSGAIRLHTAVNGQRPYAAVVTCSDSRVIPEVVFSAGIGELFVIRSAGNLPPQYKTNTLPPKVVTTRLQPIFPPGTAPTSIPQF